MTEAPHTHGETWNETPISPQEITKDMNICLTIAVDGMPRPKPSCGEVKDTTENGDSVIVELDIEGIRRSYVLFHTPPPNQTYTVVKRTLNK